MEGTAILSDKKILFAGGSAWADPTEQHFLLDMLSTSNVVIWANPFGPIAGALLPRITNLKDGFTIYNPGVNYLPFSWLSDFNERRRLLQVNMYLLEKDFEPDLVWIDDPLAARFTLYYGKKGALTLYYAHEDLDKTTSREERKQLAAAVDLILTPSPALHKKYREHTNRAFLLSGGDLMLSPDFGAEAELEDEELSVELLEKAFLDALQKCFEEVSSILKKELSKKNK